jgi:hypothetical protein
MNATKRPRGASALAVLATIVSAMTGTGLLAGCTSIGGTVTTPVSSSPASGAPGGTGSGSTGPASTGPASTGPAGNSAASAAAAALTALKAGRSVHIDITTADSPSDVTSYDDDATATGGQQVITIDGTQHATILFIGNIGYLKANVPALTGFIGVSASQAPSLAGKWLSFSPGDTLGTTTYSSLVAGITLSSVASEIELSGPDTISGTQTVDGQSVRAITSPLPASQQLPATARMTLYVTASGSLPVLEKLSGADGQENQTSFSHWGESRHLTAPSGALPVSSLGAPVLA